MSTIWFAYEAKLLREIEFMIQNKETIDVKVT